MDIRELRTQILRTEYVHKQIGGAQEWKEQGNSKSLQFAYWIVSSLNLQYGKQTKQWTQNRNSTLYFI